MSSQKKFRKRHLKHQNKHTSREVKAAAEAVGVVATTKDPKDPIKESCRNHKRCWDR
jgi:hypothetical protein